MNFKSFLKKFNQKNLDKVLDKIDKAMSVFDKGMKTFSDSMDKMNNELGSDVKRSKQRDSDNEIRSKQNLKKIWGNSNKPKIWSDKKTSLF